VSYAPGNGRGGSGRDGGPHNIATAITDVTERFSVLVREEIELAKAEVAEKTGKLARGAVVAAAAGVFLLTALFFVLIGCALLLYYVLPVGPFAYFWGFFAMAAILVVLGILAGVVAARVVKRGAPPTPAMAIEEARKIRESVSAPAATPAGDASGSEAPTFGGSAASGEGL
jgi:hypothetical protein